MTPKCTTAPPDFYDRHRVETMLGVRAARVNPRERNVSLAGGGTLRCDRLLISTGGKPLVLPVPGIDLEGVFTFTRWEDAQRTGRYIERYGAESAVVVGGGLIGLKTTEALMARSISVTVVELADCILSATFDRTASKLAETILRREGTEIRTGTTVREIVGRDGRVDHAVLQHGERVGCDLLVFATGKEAFVLSKPAAPFFRLAVYNLGMPPKQVAMVGDGIETDVDGAQRAGLVGVLVRTGKSRPGDLSGPVKPDLVVASLADLIPLLMPWK